MKVDPLLLSTLLDRVNTEWATEAEEQDDPETIDDGETRWEVRHD